MAVSTSGTNSGSGSGISAGAADVIMGWQTFDMRGARLVVRVVGDQTFRLNVMGTPDSGTSKAVMVQAASAVKSVDGGTANYVNVAEIDIVPHGEVRVEVWAVGGTLGYYYSKRIEYR